MSVKTALKSATPTPKVAAQTSAATITGLITWLLVTTYWKSGLPVDLAVALPTIVSVVWGFASGWLKKENIVIPPIEVQDESHILSSLSPHTQAWLDDVRLPGPTGRVFWKPGEEAGLPIAAFAAGNLMEDDTSTGEFTPGCAAYAGYYNGSFANMTAVRAYAAGQNARTFAYTPNGEAGADAIDMEPGLASPSAFPAFYHAKGGKNVYGYGSASWVSQIVAAASAAGIPRSAYKIVSAHYIGEHICGPSTCGYPQADATQFTDTYLGRSLDCTVFDANFFAGSTPPPPPPPAGYPLKVGSTGALVKTTQTNLNKWAKPIKLTKPLVVDGAFGALTEAAVKLALVHFDYSAANVALGEVPQSLAVHLAGAVPVDPPPPPPPPPVKTIKNVTVGFSDGTSQEIT
jgi:hypothetical protein